MTFVNYSMHARLYARTIPLVGKSRLPLHNMCLYLFSPSCLRVTSSESTQPEDRGENLLVVSLTLWYNVSSHVMRALDRIRPACLQPRDDQIKSNTHGVNA